MTSSRENSDIKDKYRSIDGWSTFLKELQLRWDYKGKVQMEVNGTTIDEPVYTHTEPYPTLKLEATHKIGGTNTSIAYIPGEAVYFPQSRTMTLDVKDYGGFVKHISNIPKEQIDDLFDKVRKAKNLGLDVPITIFGEWCGKGIPEKAAISQTEGKKWIIFNVKVTDKENPEGYYFKEPSLSLEEHNIFNILKFGRVEIDLDLSAFPPEDWIENRQAPKKLSEFVNGMTLACPIAAYFGVSGIGEGLVFTTELLGKQFSLKLKNSAYESGKLTSSKEKGDLVIDPKTEEFVSIVCSEDRLSQFIRELQLEHETISPKQTSDYLKRVIDDIKKEEQDLIATLANDTWIKQAQNTAKKYFFEQIN